MRLNCDDELIRNVGPARFCFTLNDTIMKSPVLSLYYLLLAIFLFAGCPIEQLMAQMNTDTTRYITIEGLVRDQNDRKRLEFVHVTVPGTPIGTVTNSEGVFSIKIKRSLQAKHILFTHVGYQNYRIPIDTLNQSGLKINLAPTTRQLSDTRRRCPLHRRRSHATGEQQLCCGSNPANRFLSRNCPEKKTLYLHFGSSNRRL